MGGSHSYEKKAKFVKELKSIGSGNIIPHNRKMEGDKAKKDNSCLMKFLGSNWDSFVVPSVGFSGGLMVIWRNDLAVFSIIEASSQMILGKLEVHSKGSWIVSSVYGSTYANERKCLWMDIGRHCSTDLPMVVGGDFNCVLSQSEKRGGKKFFLTQGSKDFNNFMIIIDLHEVRSMGPRFTWCNKKSGNAQILEKLDRCLINSSALNNINLHIVKHLSRIASDHCPILLDIYKPVENGSKDIRYEETWASYHGAVSLVKRIWLKNCLGDLPSALNLKIKRSLKGLFYWSKAKFMNLNLLRDKLKNEILEIQLEEDEGWISFDRLQLFRFKINELNVTLARLNTWWRQRAKARWMDEGDCNSSFFHTFANARRSNNWISLIKTKDDEWTIPSAVISNVDQIMLDVEFTREELQEVLENSVRSISPGLDGVTFSFFKDFQDVVKGDVWLAVDHFMKSRVMDRSWKETLIVLIQKIKSPQEPVHFCPISLCMTIYKIIAKMLLNRLERVIHMIILVDQAALNKDRSLSDHVLLAKEVFNKFRWSKSRSGMLAIKLDMEQAYDSMGWQMLRNGLGISISHLAPRVSHLLYADDILIFSEAKLKEVKELKKIISSYYAWTGHKVNTTKSMILFGKNTMRSIQEKVVKQLNFTVVNELNYLDVKMILRRMKASDFQVLLEAAASKLNTWGKKNISLEGKLVLTKSAFLSLPMFLSTMSLVPLSILKEFDKMCRGFLWSKNYGKTGLHYASWDLLCRPKNEGGRGLFLAVMKVGPLCAKFAWNFYSKPNTLLNLILRAKYGGDFWSGTVKKGCSSTWKIITMGAIFLKNIVRWEYPMWNSYQNDRISDTIELKGKFTGKSITTLAYEDVMVHIEETAEWNWMKKLKLKPKIDLFGWRLCIDAIPSNYFLVKRKLNNFSGCPRGCDEDEDNKHLVGKCSKLRKLKNVVQSWMYEAHGVIIEGDNLNIIKMLQNAVKNWKMAAADGRRPPIISVGDSRSVGSTAVRVPPRINHSISPPAFGDSNRFFDLESKGRFKSAKPFSNHGSISEVNCSRKEVNVISIEGISDLVKNPLSGSDKALSTCWALEEEEAKEQVNGMTGVAQEKGDLEKVRECESANLGNCVNREDLVSIIPPHPEMGNAWNMKSKVKIIDFDYAEGFSNNGTVTLHQQSEREYSDRLMKSLEVKVFGENTP
ncbi:uncharacterized protein LOC110095870 [Dendrobium catenatum]|uniref:uncharacterized protein LOC110095870 n=1 Tax=Dendrobium catenatum TaxID=906689 RepID=UPI0009F3B2CE|nr:uncharacterized protein LOC110095870 [Dendrobium catenatum]